MIQPIILLLVLILLNAVFASAELAVISVNSTKLKKMAEEGDRRAKRLMNLTEQPAKFLATIQVAITLAGLLQSAFAAENFAEPLAEALIRLGVSLPAGVLESVCIIVITLILSYFTLVFGELVPKRLAMKKSESMAFGMSGMLFLVSKIFAPVVWFLTASTNLILRLFGINPNEEDDPVTEEEIRMMLAEGNKKGTIETEENEMIQNIFEFNDISVEEICTHRKDVALLMEKDGPDGWKEVINNTMYTHYPVCGEDKDDVLGVLNTRSYFCLPEHTRESIMEHAVDSAVFIPENMKANVLFQRMKESHNYFAVIIDEYGGLSGIITLHDLIESLVGDLAADNDEEKPKDIVKNSDGTWTIQGFAELDDVMEQLEITLDIENYDTFNGFVCELIGRVPTDGESLEYEDDKFFIKVHNVCNHIIQATTVRVKEQEKDTQSE